MPRRHVLLAAAAAVVASLPGTLPAAAQASSEAVPGVKRLAGADRYATAAAIVRDSFTGPVWQVVIVSGEDYADALVGGPAADKREQPILPVGKDSIPESIRQELARLQPGSIQIIGGSAAVSDSVKAQLEDYTEGIVVRWAGADRYATAAEIARVAFSGPLPQVLIATGRDFPDALAAGAVGARTDSPVLLVEPDRIPAQTAQVLKGYKPKDIAVLGGPEVISDRVLEQLRAYTSGGVNRLDGPTRYETAARAVSIFWPNPTPVVYLATGLNFPDAVSGIPAAGREAAPLLLVQRDCMPEATREQIERLRPSTLVVLGDEGTVSDAAAAGAACS